MDTTINTQVDLAEIELRNIAAKITQSTLNSNPDSTATQVLKDPNDTSCDIGNNYPPITNYGSYYNRKVIRYAQKHKISCEEAFKRLYK